MPAPSLFTKRLILRHWRQEDLPPFAKMNADHRVMEFFPSTLSEEESNALANRIQKELQEKPYGLWAVEVKNIAPFIGFVGLHYQDFPAPFTPCIEIGWRLAFEHWRKGYAFEASTAVIQYTFETLALEEIVSFTSVKNERSRGLMEKLGMKHDPQDDFEHPKVSENHPLRPHVLYRLKNPKLKK
jgi:3-dehydroquinate dehydratase/shikimate dehydrogenase